MIRAAAVRKSFRPAASARLLLRGKLRGEPVVALDGVDLEVARGGVLGVMGPNGSGKSTLLRILAGILSPSSGEVTVCGLDASGGGAALARKVGYVTGEDRGITPHLTPRQHLAFFAALHGYPRAAALARADELLALLGIAAVALRPMRELSTGQRRRAALARGLLGQPEALILDEPTRGLDDHGAAALRSLLRARAEAGCTIVIATHDREEALALGGRVATLDRGRLS